MFTTLNSSTLLYIDIETVRYTKHYTELDDSIKELWIKRAKKINKDVSSEDDNNIQKIYEENAAFYPEFSRVVCISIGAFNKDGIFRVASFTNNDETILLKEFIKVCDKFFEKGYYVIAHNGFNFDYPFITKRCIINALNPPKHFHSYNKKPWDMFLIDSLDIWKGVARYAQTATLEEITNSLGIHTSKDLLDGSDVAKYYFDNKISDIAIYCEKDITVLKDIITKLKNLE